MANLGIEQRISADSKFWTMTEPPHGKLQLEERKVVCRIADGSMSSQSCPRSKPPLPDTSKPACYSLGRFSECKALISVVSMEKLAMFTSEVLWQISFESVQD